MISLKKINHPRRSKRAVKIKIMELKDYLHYYLGCKCFTYAGFGKLTQFDLGGHWYVSLYNKGGVTGNINDTYSECPEESKEAFPKGYPPKSILKPVLRRLEDMTEEEALHIGKLAMFDRDMKYPNSDYTVEKCGVTIELPTTYSVRINNDWFEKEIRIGFNTGNIWYANNEINERIFNQPVIFHYLLRQHFDLFGLIPAGLALDSKTILS
jgi:hypothetical protein